jgi:hypothetical protein
MNEDGPGDPYAKTDENYDAVGVKDTGTRHQEGDPPPFSLTPHTPEELQAASTGVGESYEAEHDEGQRQQDENDPPLTSVELRKDEDPDDDGAYEDQRKYAALDKRDAATAEASFANVDLADASSDGLETETVADLKRRASEEGVEGYSGLNKSDLISAIRENRGN